MIRKIQESDIDVVVEINHLCFTSQWTKSMIQTELRDNEFGMFYVLEVEGTIIGYIDFWITFETCQLASIAIHPAYQGHGYSRQLMDQMIVDANQACCETIMLEVRLSNIKAQQLYATYAFMEMNRRKGYYNDNGEDAIVLCKALGGDWL